MTPSRQLAIGLLLTALAGYIDVIGFMALGGFYISFMSGNTTQFGQGIALGLDDVTLAGTLIGLFFVGSVAGAWLSIFAKASGRIAVLAFIIVIEALVLGLGAADLGWSLAIVPLALAMGAQNAAIPSMGAARLGTTFVSGTLFAAGQDLARALHKQAPPLRWLQHAAVWLALMLGAIGGAALHAYWGMTALALPLGLHIILALALWRGPKAVA